MLKQEKQIAHKFQPEKIILFGSYADGSLGRKATWTFVMNTPLRSRQQWQYEAAVVKP